MAETGDREKVSEDGLTEEELGKCERAFAAFDKDNSGYVDAHELRRILHKMGQVTSDQEIHKMVEYASPGNTGLISKEQFKAVIARQKKYQGASN